MRMFCATPYHDLNSVLHELVSNVQDILQDDFIGAYLQGSFAVGGFDEHSDCDFIIVVSQELSPSEVENLKWLHKRIFNLNIEWAKHLEGSYFPVEILCYYEKCGTDLWYLDNGHSELERSNHCNKVVIRWILREKGVILSGPELSTLINPIPVAILQQSILTSIMNSGQEILKNPNQYHNRFYQSFIVLHFCRKLHNLYSGTVGSKREGAEWVKNNLDPSWRGLIDRAWDGRPNPSVSVQQSANETDFSMTLQFVREIMNTAHDFGVKEKLI